MTNDSHLFPPRPQWEAKGYRPDEYSRWLKGDWRPIGELWAEMGIDPNKPVPAEVELEDWLFDTSAGPERREAEKQFVHGHLLKPGDVARTNWRVRCAQPPYDSLPIPRADLPEGVVLSREADAWMRVDRIGDVALPLYQGIMIQPFMPSARGWLSGTGLRAKWDYIATDQLVWNPQYLIAQSELLESERYVHHLKVGFRDISRDTDVRSFMGALLPPFPCGHSAPVLRERTGKDININVLAFLNSFVFDWQIRQRGGAAHLIWGMLAEMALPKSGSIGSLMTNLVARLSLWPRPFAHFTPSEYSVAALAHGERARLRATVDAIVAAIYGCDTRDLAHLLAESDLPVSTVNKKSHLLDPCGFWRVDRDKPPELRHTVLTQIAHFDLNEKIKAAAGDVAEGIGSFLGQNDGDGWMVPEVICLSDYSLGHDNCAESPQPAASRLGARFFDWQLS